jgi:hypothetical protein
MLRSRCVSRRNSRQLPMSSCRPALSGKQCARSVLLLLPTSGWPTTLESIATSPFVDTYPPRCSQFMLDERFALKATAGLSPNYNPLQNESAIMAPAANRWGDHASFRSSVWYLGARSFTFFMKAASCSASRAGEGVVRLATDVQGVHS